MTSMDDSKHVKQGQPRPQGAAAEDGTPGRVPSNVTEPKAVSGNAVPAQKRTPGRACEGTTHDPAGATRLTQDASDIRPEDLNVLCEQLTAHDRQRRGPDTPTSRDEHREKFIEAVCLTLIIGPEEPGAEVQDRALLDQVRATLADAIANGLPEACVCRLWLSCADFGRTPDEQGDLKKILRDSQLWEPVQSLAFRAMAHLGQRKGISDLLAGIQPFTVVQADAWLDAAAPRPPEGQARAIEVGMLATAVGPQHSRDLVMAELQLAETGAGYEIEGKLAEIAGLNFEPKPRCYADRQIRRTVARAGAALVRARLGRGLGDDGILTGSVGQLLSAWEREYLQGLVRWVIADADEAIAALQRALELNPYQTCIRSALAAFLARRDAAAALAVLDCEVPTREVLVSRSALLVRLRRFDQAEEVLSCCNDSYPAEAPRFSWPKGQYQIRRRELALRAALYERRRDWQTGESTWRCACAGIRNKSLKDARELAAGAVELAHAPAADDARHREITHRTQRIAHEIGDRPLMGSAGFFRAVALLQSEPDQAAKDFQTLLNRKRWTDAECATGGARLLFVGDALARLGQLELAVRAYELAAQAGRPETSEPLLVLRVWAAARSLDAPAITAAANDAATQAPSFPWPQALAAVGLMMAGEYDAAEVRIDAAEKAGAAQVTCRYLRAVSAVLQDKIQTDELSETDLTSEHLSDESKALLRLITGPRPLGQRLSDFAKAHGPTWPALCPWTGEEAARRAAGDLVDDAQWNQALSLIEALKGPNAPWVTELQALVLLHRTLARAAKDPRTALQDLQNLKGTYCSAATAST